jgi:hypothetical protein
MKKTKKGVPNVGAGKTTTGVINNYKGFKGINKAKPQIAKVKKKGKL